MPSETSRLSAETTRRSVIKTAAWSAPVVAAVVATPLAAASTPGAFTLAASATQIASGTSSTVTVGIPASALPIAPQTVTLEYRLVAGTGSIITASFKSDWSYSWPQPTVLTFTASETTGLTGNVFSVAFSGAGTWSVTLQTPQGDFSTQIVVIAAA